MALLKLSEDFIVNEEQIEVAYMQDGHFHLYLIEDSGTVPAYSCDGEEAEEAWKRLSTWTVQYAFE